MNGNTGWRMLAEPIYAVSVTEHDAVKLDIGTRLRIPDLYAVEFKGGDLPGTLIAETGPRHSLHGPLAQWYVTESELRFDGDSIKTAVGAHVAWAGDEKVMPRGTPGRVIGRGSASSSGTIAGGTLILNVRFDELVDPPVSSFVMCWPHEVVGRNVRKEPS